jgi:hypothetical protein
MPIVWRVWGTLALLLLAGCERWVLDRQMEEMCSKDGGIKVYERVALPASEFNNLGQPLAKYGRLAKRFEEQLGPQYRYVLQQTVVAGRPDADPERGEGRVTRMHESVFRRADGKLLGEYTWYDRGGGDGITFGFQPSGKSCPKPAVSLVNSIFYRGD